MGKYLNKLWLVTTRFLGEPWDTSLRRCTYNKIGKQLTILAVEEEKIFIWCTIDKFLWISVNNIDLKCIVIEYLQSERIVAEFKNNMPSNNWAWNFTNRHPALTNRFATNIKKLRAAINETTLACYISSLREFTGVSSKNIWKCNESYWTYNRDQKKVIVKKRLRVLGTHL